MKKSTKILWGASFTEGVVLNSSGSYWHKIGSRRNGVTAVNPEEAFWLCVSKKATVCDEFLSQIRSKHFELIVHALFPLKLTMVRYY